MVYVSSRHDLATPRKMSGLRSRNISQKYYVRENVELTRFSNPTSLGDVTVERQHENPNNCNLKREISEERLGGERTRREERRGERKRR